MVNRLDRSQPHRDCGELPELRHKPRMRIRTESSARFQFAAEVLQLLFRNTAFQISARIHSGSGVALKVNNVAVAVFRLGAKEMIERNFVERGRRGES